MFAISCDNRKEPPPARATQRILVQSVRSQARPLLCFELRTLALVELLWMCFLLCAKKKKALLQICRRARAGPCSVLSGSIRNHILLLIAERACKIKGEGVFDIGCMWVIDR